MWGISYCTFLTAGSRQLRWRITDPPYLRSMKVSWMDLRSRTIVRSVNWWRGCLYTRPPTRKLVPSWDLFSVLSTLSQPPFEPISNATLLQLSIKVVFLLAVATSRRRSELHSLSVATGHIRWEPGGVRLIPVLGFLTKNQCESFMPPDIFVPDIKSFSAVADDKLWCPVRALKWYTSHTASLRAGHKQLFITTTSPFRPASRDTIARWIVTAIRSVPGGWPAADGPIRAHDVRGVSSSWWHHPGSLFRGAPKGGLSPSPQEGPRKKRDKKKEKKEREGGGGGEKLQMFFFQPFSSYATGIFFFFLPKLFYYDVSWNLTIIV